MTKRTTVTTVSHLQHGSQGRDPQKRPAAYKIKVNGLYWNRIPKEMIHTSRPNCKQWKHSKTQVSKPTESKYWRSGHFVSWRFSWRFPGQQEDTWWVSITWSVNTDRNIPGQASNELTNEALKTASGVFWPIPRRNSHLWKVVESKATNAFICNHATETQPSRGGEVGWVWPSSQIKMAMKTFPSNFHPAMCSDVGTKLRGAKTKQLGQKWVPKAYIYLWQNSEWAPSEFKMSECCSAHTNGSGHNI